MSIQELVKMSVRELVDAYAARRLSPVEVLNTTLNHAEKVNPAINALFHLRPEEALDAAAASEARWKARTPQGLLDGVPMTVKESVSIVGWPNTHGVRANRNLPPSSYDSPPTLALRESGAPIFAKTTMPDCGLLASGVSSMHGIIRNPWGLKWNTGGSSAGAGAAVAAGVGHLTVGTDIAGSVRLPSAHCGLASLKPTHGRVPHLPPDMMRMAGPMGRSVEDIARLLTVLTRPDERDTWSFPVDATQYHERLGRDVKGLRIGLLTEMGFGPKPEAEVRHAVDRAGKALAEAGAIVEPFISPFDFDAFAPIDMFLQVRGLAEINALPSHGEDGVNCHLRDWALRGAKYSGTDLYEALGQIARVRAMLLAAFEPYDYLVAAVMPLVNFPAESPGPDASSPLGHTMFTALFNQTGQPAATVCTAFDERRLPIGVQVIGHRGDDLGVLQVAKVLEDMRETPMDWPLTPRA
jgi:Asp-tRNA(Asn)/Glu-tRNA(Gln) amidotransferase A subunit family amidase